ncbi:efflux RND transporter permease subunit [Acidisoma cladoniae]|jgi:hydrophobe/amphiphile efflux-1 (HAE1) family protein|uniref:efflux RND transporter permease subunit n=1 Tax=Acidisoma cladoniae TaxID=3040935 RepID=UPI00254A2DC5|nr:efflux RND transporter permease subunit [Acidisoma sp. PAMC 29798]
MSISSPFIRRPIATSLIAAAIFLAGLAAYPSLPIAPLPNVEFPTLTVTASYPGASPETMASTVATPLETEFGQMLPGLSQMTSASVLGTTQITLQFGLGVNLANAETLVLEAMNAAQGSLPKGMPSPPTFRAVNPADSPIMTLAMQSDQAPITDVDSYAENVVEQQISQLPGVGQVLVGGQQTPAIRVQVDPARLANMGLTMEDVRTVLTNVTVDNPKGSVDGPDRSFTIYANDQLTTAAPYNNVIIAYKNGAPIRIGDIGHAVSGPQNRELAAWTNGKRSVLLLIFKQPNANVIATADGVKAKLPALRADFPPDIHLNLISDRTQTIRASVNDVEFTLLLAICLVVMVIFLFLRNLWATVIPSVTIPVALVGTLGMMYICGFSLDNLSLMGLTIAVGFVVDDAIVMLENIFRHIEAGMKPMDAALQGAGEIGFTIVSISFSLIAVFIPLLLMGGIVGRLFREFAICVSITIIISAMVSLTLTPMMCARFLSPEAHQHGRFYNAVERMFKAMVDFYEKTLDIALRFQFITLMVFIGTVALTVFLYIIIPKGFFPTQDTGIIIGITEVAQDASYGQISKLQERVNALVLKDPAVASVAASVGAGAGGQTANNGRMYITLKPWGQRPGMDASQVVARIDRSMQQLAGIKLFMQPAQDVSVGARLGRTLYQYTLQDAQQDELNAWAPKILAKMRTLPTVTDVTSDQENSGTTETLTYDRDQAARFGIQPATIDNILYDAFGQREVAQYFTGNKAYYVILEAMPDEFGRVATLRKLYVQSSSGIPVPLSTLVHHTTVPVQPLAINHQSQFPSVTISFNLKGAGALGAAVSQVQQMEASMGVPSTVQGSFQGTAQAFQSSLKSEPYLVMAALIAVYIILGILYESYILPLTILSTLSSAGVGALLMLMIFHYQLTVIALIGIILLIGIVKKNGIMMVDFAINAERREGKSPHEAIRQACLMRFRPILMTTMAAIFSGLPLMLESGAGSELRKPLGFAMVGGLLLSQVLTLYTTPVIYLYLDRLQTALSPQRLKTLPRLASKMDPMAKAAE